MKVIETELDGVLVLEPKVFGDDRGFFIESYSKRAFEEIGLDIELVQDNHSLSVQAGVLRGLHFQKAPKAQTKVVRVTAGAIMDVIVDIRRNSPSYGKHIKVMLTADNFRQVIVPKGFAHGFLTLVPNTQVQYKVDEFYEPEHDRSVRWDDPELNIDWGWSDPILSQKDAGALLLKESDHNFIYGENV